MNELIQNTITHVKTVLNGAEAGHDWFHIERVDRMAVRIGEAEGNVDMLIVRLVALLHDIADAKFNGGDEEEGPRQTRAWLESQGVDETIIEHVENGVRHISYKSNIGGQKWMSPELAVVQDADRIDALGAIGIARTFNYGGHKDRELYNPAIPPNPDMSQEEYKNGTPPTLNHFPDKLFKLKGLMNTETGRQIAAERDAFCHEYYERFLKEWAGEL